MPIPLTYAVNILAGALMMGLGLYVVLVRPRRAGNVAFAAFAFASGLRAAAAYVDASLGYDVDTLPSLVANAIALVAAVVGTGALVAMGRTFPQPLVAREVGPFRALLGLCGVTALLIAASVMLDIPGFARNEQVEGSWSASAVVGSASDVVVAHGAVAWLLFVAFLAWRFAARDAAPQDRRQFFLVGFALAIWPGILLGNISVGLFGQVFLVVGLASVVLAAASWLRNAALDAGHARGCRDLALLLLAAPIIGAVIAVAEGAYTLAASGGPQYAIARAASVALFAYAILRTQLLGLDVRVRWTVKNSTVAAAFVGVFFVVSNGVQTFFQGTLGPYVGIVAAGGLVFAMAPLQRVAEWLAERAVPAGAPAPPDERRVFYRRQLELAWADGRVSRKERALLRELRLHLGIPAEEADALEAEVARPPGARVRP